jgi:hypothetical protein
LTKSLIYGQIGLTLINLCTPQVYDGGDDDENGYFWAEIRGRYGLVIPAEKLGEIADGDLFLAAERRDGGGEQQQPSWPAANGTSGRSTITISKMSKGLKSVILNNHLQSQSADRRVMMSSRRVGNC